jgi:LmbE family N-acetylglucosaminyl deacetylase
MGKDVHYVAFSKCEQSLPAGAPKDLLVHELMNATKVLGIPPGNIHVLNFEVRCFQRDRQEILDAIIGFGKKISPDLVFLPSPNDLHQDHHTITMEGLRAFKLSASILAYEMPWNNLVFNTTCFSPLTRQQINKKVEALKCYESQLGRFYASEEFIYALATTRGTQVNTRYAESFEVLRWVF